MERTGMLDKVRQVVDAARETDALIIHSPVIMKANELFQEADFDSQNYSKQYGLFTEGTWNAEFVEETKPNEDEIVLSGRNDFNAFKGTELTQLLQENDIETLYIMGFLTNVCVEDTVIAATELLPHLRVVVLTDGCAALTMKEHNLTINASLPVLCDTTSCAEFIYSGKEMPIWSPPRENLLSRQRSLPLSAQQEEGRKNSQRSAWKSTSKSIAPPPLVQRKVTLTQAELIEAAKEMAQFDMECKEKRKGSKEIESIDAAKEMASFLNQNNKEESDDDGDTTKEEEEGRGIQEEHSNGKERRLRRSLSPKPSPSTTAKKQIIRSISSTSSLTTMFSRPSVPSSSSLSLIRSNNSSRLLALQSKPVSCMKLQESDTRNYSIHHTMNNNQTTTKSSAGVRFGTETDPTHRSAWDTTEQECNQKQTLSSSLQNHSSTSINSSATNLSIPTPIPKPQSLMEAPQRQLTLDVSDLQLTMDMAAATMTTWHNEVSSEIVDNVNTNTNAVVAAEDNNDSNNDDNNNNNNNSLSLSSMMCVKEKEDSLKEIKPAIVRAAFESKEARASFRSLHTPPIPIRQTSLVDSNERMNHIDSHYCAFDQQHQQKQREHHEDRDREREYELDISQTHQPH